MSRRRPTTGYTHRQRWIDTYGERPESMATYESDWDPRYLEAPNEETQALIDQRKEQEGIDTGATRDLKNPSTDDVENEAQEQKRELQQSRDYTYRPTQKETNRETDRGKEFIADYVDRNQLREDDRYSYTPMSDERRLQLLTGNYQ